ncbi:MAG TPA: hypothetical protein VG733_17365 [Chthoniobacteraceae bacterium]|nr:hypothetical protein [Chthoniobacteraceae bacterium]
MQDSLLLRYPGKSDHLVAGAMAMAPLGLLVWVMTKIATGFLYTGMTPLRDWFIGMSALAGFIAIAAFMAALLLKHAMEHTDYRFGRDGVTISKYRLWWKTSIQSLRWSDVESVEPGITGGFPTSSRVLYLRTKNGCCHLLTYLQGKENRAKWDGIMAIWEESGRDVAKEG